MHAPQRTSKPILAALAILIVCAIFFDVVFLHASLQPSNISPQIGKPQDWSAHSWLPQLNPATQTGYGFGDLGASLWQSEPARYFMARNFRDHESPYWNPYSASGTVGPETLVDIKFSPWTLISAYFFNASPESFDYGLIIIYGLGAFFLLLILHQQLLLPLLPACLGVVVYLLNGFAAPNLNSHMGQPYFFFPLLLFSLFQLIEKQTFARWLFVVLTHALLLLITFLPTLLLVLLTCHALALGYLWRKQFTLSPFLQYAKSVVAAVVFAFLLDAFLWLPIIHSFSITDLLSDFTARTLQHPNHINNLLSIFTPKHFWENNSLISHAALYPGAHLNRFEVVIPYVGIFTALFIALGLPWRSIKNDHLILLGVLLIIIATGYTFGFFSLFRQIPFIRTIGKQYWGVVSAIPLCLLVAIVSEALPCKRVSSLAGFTVLAVMVYAFFILYKKLGMPTQFPYTTYTSLVLVSFGIGCIIICLIWSGKYPGLVLASVLGFSLVLELLFYLNTVRPLRYNPQQNEPAVVHFLRQQGSDYRILNCGLSGSLYPEYGALFGIRQIDTQNPALLPWYKTFFLNHLGTDSMFFLSLGGSVDAGNALTENILDDIALQVSSTRFVLVSSGANPYLNYFQQHNYPKVFSGDGISIFENINALGTATLASSLLLAEQLPKDNSFNPHLQATTTDATLLAHAKELGIAVLDHVDPKPSAVHGTATVSSYHHTEIIIATAADSASILALSEVWHPDWKATIDDQPAYIGRINEAFRGIALPAGHHRVRVYYDNKAVVHGKLTSLITLGMLVLAACIARYRQQARLQLP